MKWSKLINDLLNERDFSIYAFSKFVGLNHVTIINILNGKTSEVHLKTKNKLEKAFHIKIDDTDPDNLIVTKSITQMTDELIGKYGQTKNNSAPAVGGNYVLGTVTAGRGTVLDFENEQIDVVNYPVDTCFWYVIDKHNGDSMYPLLVENDRILVDRAYPKKLIKETDLVMVVYQGGGAVKFFSRSEDDANILVFYSSNGSVAPLILRKENCEYFKVVLIKKL